MFSPRRALGLFLTLGLVALAGCAPSAPASRPAAATPYSATTAAAADHGADASMAAGASILSGFDLAPSRNDWQIGDRVLLGIRFSRPDRADTIRFLLVELTNRLDPKMIKFHSTSRSGKAHKFSSFAAQTRLALYDEQGRLIDESTGRFAVQLLGCGLFDGVHFSAEHPEYKGRMNEMVKSLDDRQWHSMHEGWLTLISFSSSLGRRGMFRDMLDDLVAKPGWLRMLLNPSVALGFADGWPAFDESWSPTGEPGLRTIRVPLLCRIADRDGARADVVVTEPVAPLSLCGGVLAINAENADDPRVQLQARLLAAQRGTGGQGFTIAEADKDED